MPTDREYEQMAEIIQMKCEMHYGEDYTDDEFIELANRELESIQYADRRHVRKKLGMPDATG